jgi:signal transduction histidine kinase
LNSIDDTTEIVYPVKDIISVRLLQEICKTKEQIDICIKFTNNSSSTYLTTELLINSLNEIKRNRKIKSRCIVDTTNGNIDCSSEKLISLMDEIRFSNAIENSFFINETSYTSILIAQKINTPPAQQQQLPQLIISNVKSFVSQQKYFFELLWDESTLEYKSINQIGAGKINNGKEIQQQPTTMSKPVIKTKVLENQQEIFKAVVDFYKTSNQLKFCSPLEAIKIIYSNFFNYHLEILDRYRQGNHKGIRWITSLNNKEDVDLVRSYIDKGIEIRHVKDLLTNSFSLSDKAFLFTIEKVEKGIWGHSVLISNDKSYINQYDDLFENLWKKGIDIEDRIKAIEKGHYINVDLIPNSTESLKFSRGLLNNALSEVLVILSSATAIFRVENNIGFEIFNDLAFNGIKVKILIPLGEELDFKINHLKSKYTKIEFRNLHTTLKSLIGIIVIDREKVLLVEIKDETSIRYIDSMGLTISLEGKSAALSYFSIFDSLWKQTEIYDEIKKAYGKIQTHNKMQKEFINTAAHELRTPIQPIIGITAILNNEIQSKRHKEFLEILLRNVRRLKSLSEDILDVTKIEGNSLILNKEPFTMMKIIIEIIENYKNEATIKNIKFKCLFPEDNNDFVVYVDKTRISQVISNLINNSIKFISDEKEKGTITIIVEKRKSSDTSDVDSKDMVVVMVKDNGTGIDKQILPNLFTKFASKSFQGTGLGLFISKSIVESHGGKMWAENNEDGEKGATFGFSLPFVS